MQATEVMPLPVVASDAEHLDPELLEIFIEEAKQEIASIKRHLPLWADSPDDMEMLITVRRSFHTLKGSGRMVGAERIGEYAWAIEESVESPDQSHAQTYTADGRFRTGGSRSSSGAR